MAEYLLSVWHDEFPTEPEPEMMERLGAKVGAFNEEVQAAGAWVFAGGLHPPSSATVVRAADGGVTITDGPHAAAKEAVGGSWIIDVADLDAALEWARKGSEACEGPVEVRPFQAE